MKNMDREQLGVSVLPVHVLQFGGGNFLRAFVDGMIDRYNRITEAGWGVAVMKVTPKGDYENWRAQGGLFHIKTKGLLQGRLVEKTDRIDCISQILHAYGEWEEFLATAALPEIRFLVSNTTESGMMISEQDRWSDSPPTSFPAKLTCWLHRRFTLFGGAKEAGCICIPCELVKENGKLLQSLVLQTAEKWKLGEAFTVWVQEACIFCNTLVDRIVPGIHGEKKEEAWAELGYKDEMMTEAEPYHLWAIEAPAQVQTAFPLYEAGLNVVFTDDLEPFRKRKVRILNGAHTALVPVGYLLGQRIVREAVGDSLSGKFLSHLLDQEILPVMEMPEDEVNAYAETVIERFKNPFIDHYLISISLNSWSKFTTRLLPSMEDYLQAYGRPPKLICCALACQILMYKGVFEGESIPLRDAPEVLQKLQTCWESHPEDMQALTRSILSWVANWGKDLSQNEKLVKEVARHLEEIQKEGLKMHLQNMLT